MAEGSGLLRHGGWVLVFVGVLQIALAALLHGASVVAPVFAFLGAACVVLGVVLERAEGNLELGPSRLRLVLRELEQRPEILRASGETIVDALDSQLDASNLNRLLLGRPDQEDVAKRFADEVSRRVIAEQVSVANAAHWLRAQGWDVAETDRAGFPYDLVAKRGDEEVMYVDVKRSDRLLGTGAIARTLAVARLMPSVASGRTRYALYLAGPGLTPEAMRTAAHERLIVYVETPDGSIETLG